MTTLNHRTSRQRGGRRAALALAVRRRPLVASIVVTIAAWGVLWCGKFPARWLASGSPWYPAVERVLVVLAALALLWATAWWRRSGTLRRPTLAGVRLAWPAWMLLAWLFVLVAWRGEHAWLAVLSDNLLTSLWEEAIFRGFVVALLLRGGKTLAVVGSAVLFAAVHFMVLFADWAWTARIWGIVWPFGLGIFFAGLRLRTGTIWWGVLLHWIGNTLNDMSPRPLTWSGAMLGRISIELAVCLLLYISWGGVLTGWWRRRGVLVSGVAAVALIVMCIVGVGLGGPRVGWDGPGWDANIRMLKVRDVGTFWQEYRYRLRFRAKQARVVRVTLRFTVCTHEVRDVFATAGTKRWDGRVVRDEISWAGGVAPRTHYMFTCKRPPDGTIRFRIDYLDRYGWPRHWSSTIDGPG